MLWLVLGTLLLGGRRSVAGHISIDHAQELRDRGVFALRETESESDASIVAARDPASGSPYREMFEALAMNHMIIGKDTSARFIINDHAVYLELLEFRDAHPSVFDHNHPFYARLLRDTAFADSLIAKMEHHVSWFEKNEPFLWIVLEGMAPNHDLRPNHPPTIVSPANDPFHLDAPPDPPPPGPPAGTPEPAASLLMVLGLAGIPLAVAWRRRSDALRK
jgi:hypothetical protein